MGAKACFYACPTSRTARQTRPRSWDGDYRPTVPLQQGRKTPMSYAPNGSDWETARGFKPVTFRGESTALEIKGPERERRSVGQASHINPIDPEGDLSPARSMSISGRGLMNSGPESAWSVMMIIKLQIYTGRFCPVYSCPSSRPSSIISSAASRSDGSGCG